MRVLLHFRKTQSTDIALLFFRFTCNGSASQKWAVKFPKVLDSNGLCLGIWTGCSRNPPPRFDVLFCLHQVSVGTIRSIPTTNSLWCPRARTPMRRKSGAMDPLHSPWCQAPSSFECVGGSARSSRTVLHRKGTASLWIPTTHGTWRQAAAKGRLVVISLEWLRLVHSPQALAHWLVNGCP